MQYISISGWRKWEHREEMLKCSSHWALCCLLAVVAMVVLCGGIGGG